MTLEDFKARVGGSVKRRLKISEIANSRDHLQDAWKEVEVKNEQYAAYYFNLQQHGYEFRV
jgi:hypothetical protein